MNKYRRVIFLDIDGVLQPDKNRNRFNHNLIQLRQEIAGKYNDENYLKLGEWDIGAVYYINEYLEKNNDILAYVVIDYADLSKYYPNNFVCTRKEDYLDGDSTFISIQKSQALA